MNAKNGYIYNTSSKNMKFSNAFFFFHYITMNCVKPVLHGNEGMN